jgi:hypothetical protein
MATTNVEAIDPAFDLGTAVAISAALRAVGASRTTADLPLALLNVRLNYCCRIRHGPGGNMDHASGFAARPRLPPSGGVWPRTPPPFINCSDGAHVRNLGVTRAPTTRQTIICGQPGCEPHFTFFGFISLQRYAEIDLGATIRSIWAGAPERRGSPAPIAVSTIEYGKVSGGSSIEAFTNGDSRVRYYRSESPHSPRTSDQFFDETQFETTGHSAACRRTLCEAFRLAVESSEDATLDVAARRLAVVCCAAHSIGVVLCDGGSTVAESLSAAPARPLPVKIGCIIDFEDRRVGAPTDDRWLSER